MAAITKAFTIINDTAVDPDSPVDTALVTALRDNATHLREWLGASFYAAAAQDHAHDGVTSALVEIGPNLLRNASFESGESGWTFTDYSGGSHAISAAEYIHGVKSLAITSTVLANGGGYAESNEHIPVGGSQFLSFEIWRWASVANISSKCEVVWYDNAKAQISVAAVYSDTNTPTATALVQTGLQAPSTARYARLRVTGGVPGTGTATGTVYFDGGMIGRTYIVEPLIGPAAVTEPKIGGAAVSQGKLKTATGEITNTSSIISYLTLPGGSYGFYPQIRTDNATYPVGWGMDGDAAAAAAKSASTTFVAIAGLASAVGTNTTARMQQRYISASPPWAPYRANDAVPIFVFALIDKSAGKVIVTYTAEDPPWGNNGPTIINPLGRVRQLMKSKMPVSFEEVKADRRQLSAYVQSLHDAEAFLDDPANATVIHTELSRKFTQKEKNADMALIPHPFSGFDPVKYTVVVVNPTDDKFCGCLHLMHTHTGDSVADILHGDYLILDNAPIPGLVCPPGVMPVRARWKLT